MSQEINYKQVMALEAQNYQREFAPLLAQIMNSAPTTLCTKVREVSKVKAVCSNKIVAPSELLSIQRDFDEIVQKQGSITPTNLKVAAIATLVNSQDNLLVSKTNTVFEDNVMHIVEGNSISEVQRAIKSTFKTLRENHTALFVDHLSTAVSEASTKIGFKEIKIMEENSLLRVVASNSAAQSLVTEIDFSAKEINMAAELTGFHDGSCKRVMEQFSEELSKRGVTQKEAGMRATNGISQMAFIKKMTKPVKRRIIDEETPNNQITDINITAKN